MKKLLIVIAVFALVLGAKLASTQAFSLGPVTLGADPNHLFMKFSGATVSQDLTYQPGDAIWGGKYDSWLGAEGDDYLDPTTGSVAGGDAMYGETWGIMKLDVIEDEFGGDRWSAAASGEDVYVYFYGFYDKNVTFDAGTGKFDVDSVGGEFKMILSTDADDTGEYGIGLPGGGIANRSAFDEFDTITDIGGIDFLHGEFSGSVDPLDEDVTAQQSLDISTSPATGDGTAFADILGGQFADMFDTDAEPDLALGGPTDAHGNTHDLFFIFDVEPATAGLELAGWDQKIDDPIHAYVKPIPEPTTVALLGIGLVGMAGVAVRKKYGKKKN